MLLFQGGSHSKECWAKIHHIQGWLTENCRFSLPGKTATRIHHLRINWWILLDYENWFEPIKHRKEVVRWKVCSTRVVRNLFISNKKHRTWCSPRYNSGLICSWSKGRLNWVVGWLLASLSSLQYQWLVCVVGVNLLKLCSKQGMTTSSSETASFFSSPHATALF